jgi:3-(3-hydroxy-phenyl)propionate hydroxylase
VIPRIKAMLGDEREFELEWVSVYTFQCRRMNRFNHGRVLFVGDAAHQVSPFGARGANSGIQDADNLVWKLALVMDGKAPATLLDTYGDERGFAADENIMNSTRSTDFITPKSRTSRTFRNAVLGLAEHHPFARALVNSGRLSVPSFLVDSRLNTADDAVFAGNMVPGAPMDDAPIEPSAASPGCCRPARRPLPGAALRGRRRRPRRRQRGRAAVARGRADSGGADRGRGARPARSAGLRTLIDAKGRIRERYDLQPGTTYLARPDQHVAARWRALDPARVRAAVARATCNA